MTETESARPIRARRVAPHGWVLDDAASAPLSADDARLADARAERIARVVPVPGTAFGTHGGRYVIPHGRMTVVVPDARVAIRVRPAAAPSVPQAR